MQISERRMQNEHLVLVFTSFCYQTFMNSDSRGRHNGSPVIGAYRGAASKQLFADSFVLQVIIAASVK